MKLESYLQFFSKNAQISNFMKIRLVGAELFLADRRTDDSGRADKTKLVIVFRNFAKEPKNYVSSVKNSAAFTIAPHSFSSRGTRTHRPN
jgi:ribosomal protein L30E